MCKSLEGCCNIYSTHCNPITATFPWIRVFIALIEGSGRSKLLATTLSYEYLLDTDNPQTNKLSFRPIARQLTGFLGQLILL